MRGIAGRTMQCKDGCWKQRVWQLVWTRYCHEPILSNIDKQTAGHAAFLFSPRCQRLGELHETSLMQMFYSSAILLDPKEDKIRERLKNYHSQIDGITPFFKDRRSNEGAPDFAWIRGRTCSTRWMALASRMRSLTSSRKILTRCEPGP